MSVGVAIKETMRHAQTVMREVSALFCDIDTELGDLRLKSVCGNEVFFDTAKRDLRIPSGWQQATLARLYGQGGQSNVSERVLAVEVHLLPDLFEEAVLVLACAQGGGVGGIDWYKRYNAGEWVLSLYTQRPRFDEERQWKAPLQPAVFTGAATLRSVVLPLAAMTGREAIRAEIVARAKTWFGLPVEAGPQARAAG